MRTRSLKKRFMAFIFTLSLLLIQVFIREPFVVVCVRSFTCSPWT